MTFIWRIDIFLRDHSLFMTGGGLAKKGGGSWGIFDQKRGGPKNIGSEGGVQLFIIVVL